ncbi:MAG: M20 family metallo-hydrolase [Planctomycetes bacterium]|nr:M20 family metallo-hydrolase [Planctomycetota bacterium]
MRPTDDWILDHEDAMVQLQAGLTRRPAISPENGGQGEWEKAAYLEQYLRDHGIEDIERFDCPDEKAPEGLRPNFVASIPGRTRTPCIWALTHVDVVPPGEKAPDGSWKGWDSDPFQLRRAGDRIIGRGVTDNQQSIVSSVFGALALLDTGRRPAHTVRLLFVSDEETGNEYGLLHVLRQRGDMFSPRDIIIVPDAGNEDGTMIEIAEKSVLWVEFHVCGRQAHGSRPDRAINAFRAASELACLLDEELHEHFDRADDLYEPPRSTFEPTLHEANVPNVNTIPGEDVFCFDCRVLPDYDLDSVLNRMKAACAHVDAQTGASTRIETLMRTAAPPATAPDAPVVKLLKSAVREALGVEPRAQGIGGATVARLLRERGLPAAAWMTSSGTEHQANESCSISNMISDARVFARVYAG